MKSLPILFLLSAIFVFLPFSVLELIADIQVIEEDDFVSRPIESLERIIELAPNGIMVPETMLKLAHLRLERESKDSRTGILHQLVERYPIRKRGKKLARYLKISSELAKSV